jgi:hypothetical protein
MGDNAVTGGFVNTDDEDLLWGLAMAAVAMVPGEPLEVWESKVRTVFYGLQDKACR